MKKMIITIAIVAFTLMLTASSQQQENVVNVYYFHGNTRCVTCTKMETMIIEAVEKTFANEIKSNKIKFQIINFDEKANENYVKTYDLFNQTLVISLNKGGKESKWKSADKIWQLNRKEKEFKNYVINEIREYLKDV